MMRVLPVLEPDRKSLELCVYCPKLCRAACPVSNATAKETLTPWGKMSTAYFVARGDVPLDEEHAATAWACTGCYACSERCDHHNQPALGLEHARAAMMDKGVGPAGAKRVVRNFGRHRAKTAAAVTKVAAASSAYVSEAGTPILVGCSYARAVPDVARDALRTAAILLGGPVRPIRACCGANVRMAGDRKAFADATLALQDELRGAERLVVVDPGCATSLVHHAPSVEGWKPREIVPLVSLAAANLRRFETEAAPPHAVRWHDPCHMGRGLGLFGEPRAVLARILGRAPDEFEEHGRMAACSGGGGVLPATMPETSAAIAEARVSAHRRDGDGEIVTACAESLRAFRRRGARATDLVSWMARALRD